MESFKADDTPGGKAFVRGGVINPNDRSKPVSESVPRGMQVNQSDEGSSGKSISVVLV